MSTIRNPDGIWFSKNGIVMPVEQIKLYNERFGEKFKQFVLETKIVTGPTGERLLTRIKNKVWL